MAPIDNDQRSDMATALHLHQMGKLDQAIPIYERVTKSNPDQADGWHLLGLAHYQTGRAEIGLGQIRSAINLDGARAVFHTNLAIILNALDRPVEAGDAARRAIELDAEDGDAFHHLGVALSKLEQLPEAETAIQEAVRLDPENAEYLNNLGAVIDRAGRAAEAEDMFRRAVTSDPKSTPAAMNLAEVLIRLNRLQDAEDIYRKRISEEPDAPKPYLMLGNILLQRMRPEAAAEAFERCVAIDPQNSEAIFKLARALAAAGDAERALALLDKADAMSADNPRTAYLLGILRKQTGAVAEAGRLFARTLELDPDNGPAYLELITTVRQPFNPAQLAALNDLTGENAAQKLAIPAHFALAHHYDIGKEYASAGAHLTGANAGRKASLADLSERFDRAAFGAKITSLIEIFTPGLLARLDTGGAAGARPIFVVGVPRSGTTLVERIIASHKDCFGAGELTEIEQVPRRLGKNEEDYPSCLGQIEPGVLENTAAAILRKYSEIGGAAVRVVDKYPANFMHVGLIHLLFPDAAIICCRRDFRDIGLSCYFQNFSYPVPWSFDLQDIGRYILGFTKLMEHWHALLPGRVYDIGYENLVRRPDEQIRKLIDHLNLEWDPACLSFQGSEGSVGTASNVQVRGAMHTNSIGRWRGYQAMLEPMMKILDAEF